MCWTGLALSGRGMLGTRPMLSGRGMLEAGLVLSGRGMLGEGLTLSGAPVLVHTPQVNTSPCALLFFLGRCVTEDIRWEYSPVAWNPVLPGTPEVALLPLVVCLQIREASLIKTMPLALLLSQMNIKFTVETLERQKLKKKKIKTCMYVF